MSMTGKKNGAEKSLYFRKKIEEQGYTLLNEYIHERTKLEMLCPKGHKRSCGYEAFKRGTCLECRNEAKLKALLEKVEEEGYTIITLPKNARSKLIAECPNGHLREANAHNYLNHRCSYCVGKNTPKNIEYCKEIFSSRGFELIEENYVSCKTFMKYRCSCGSVGETTLDIISHSEISSCRSCFGEKQSGELHPRWNFNLSSEERAISRNFPEYVKWRAAVYKRDGYTCRCCDSKGGVLEAHHIENYSTNQNLRVEISNGITLCKEHHSEFHKMYSRFNNNIYQLQEYFNNTRGKLNLPQVVINTKT